MAKDIRIPVTLKGNRLEAKASLGQTVIVTEGPETYTGPVTVTPTETEQTLLTKDKLLTDNISVNPIPSEYVDAKADYDNALTAFGVESDLADDITALTEYSNSVTGEQDENLSDAVRSLADGYSKNKLSDYVGGFISGVFYDETITRMSATFPANTSVEEINLPNLTNLVASNAIRGSSLKKLLMPNLSGTHGYSAFEGNASLEVIDIGNANILSSSLRNLPSLKVLVIRRNAQNVTGYGWCGGSSLNPSSGAEKCKIYVPQEYLQNYLNNTVWAGLNADFYPIEGSEYEL